MSGEVLLASLGGQPQVVTFLLDALRERGFHLDVVYTVFPGGHPRYQAAHRRLQEEFGTYPAYRGMAYQGWGLTDPRSRPLPDVLEDAHLDAAWNQIRDKVQRLKHEGYRVHFGITGGRRALGLILYAAAMTYGTSQDRVWHLYTPPEWLPRVREGARMHLPPGTVRLLAMPFVPWTAYLPGLRAVLDVPAHKMRALLGTELTEETARRCQWVWERLSPRQREALQVLVATDTRKEAAGRMGVKLSTLDSHRKVLLALCRQAWPEGPEINLRFVRRIFRAWLQAQAPLPHRVGRMSPPSGEDGGDIL